MTTVEDEYGRRWLVKAGDPANALILKLPDSCQLVVLPTDTLRTGELAGFQVLPDDLVKRYRMFDVMEYLFA